MKTLQDLVNATAPGGTLDLGDDTYTIGADPNFRYPLVLGKPITIVGAGATLDVQHSTLRNRPALLVRGAQVKLLGQVTIRHDDNADVGDEAFEGQHGIETQGAANFACNWWVENIPATSFYIGRNLANVPSTNVTLNSPHSINAGRQHIALQGVKQFLIHHAYMENCGAGHSSIVFEPNGHNDVCQNGTIRDCFYRGNTGWCFSAGGRRDGQPAHGNLANVTLLRMTSKDVFSIMLDHGPGNRRGPFTADECTGGGTAHHPVIVCHGIDGLHVTNFKQPASPGVKLFSISPDCTNVVTSLAV